MPRERRDRRWWRRAGAIDASLPPRRRRLKGTRGPPGVVRPPPKRQARAIAAARAPWERRRMIRLAPRGLHVCAACRAEFVYPEARRREVDARWWRATRAQWWLRLRCGSCGARREVVVPEALVERFEIELERARAAIAHAIAASERTRMAAMVDALVLALERDLIDAADFALPRAPM
jgi:hypothetical protein